MKLLYVLKRYIWSTVRQLEAMQLIVTNEQLVCWNEKQTREETKNDFSRKMRKRESF